MSHVALVSNLVDCNEHNLRPNSSSRKGYFRVSDLHSHRGDQPQTESRFRSKLVHVGSGGLMKSYLNFSLKFMVNCSMLLR